MKRTLLSMVVLLSISFLQGQTKPRVAPPSKSDTLATLENGHRLRIQRGELPIGHFQIAGVDLTLEKDTFEQAYAKFGRIESAASGDAGDFDEQICYQSLDQADKTKLIFGRGEVNSYFTLTSEPMIWKPKQKCLPSKLISAGLKDNAGVQLGQSEAQVIALLGLPTSRSEHQQIKKIFYEFEMDKKAKPSELKLVKERYPSWSEKEILQNYGTHSQNEGIRLMFFQDRLVSVTANFSATN
jgi:hypothetical protein